MQQVNIYEAKTHLSKLLCRVEAGEEVIIAKSGKAIAKLVPVKKKNQKRILGDEKGKIWISEDFNATLPEELLKEFYK